ncbi:hypothetical protein [Segetibacter aerophilus]|uniref:Uncharacterized protein n=1 Tax=Segetibacter aerophilus TaxID=670293 RepID=A0A512B9V7_9BACT|nr:hypothetical protein [Segetibacter aerophilus]GEO08750.1 hypothetical protein SAE01_12460 [Segetibacter aerophilus]
MSCGNYKEVEVNYCPDAFLFSGYDYEAYVQWQFKNLNGQVVRGDALTSALGVLELPVDGSAGLTKEMFQHFSGFWEFRSWGVDSLGNIDPFVFCQEGEPFDFLVFKFAFIDPLPEPNNINILFETCTMT